MNTDDAVLVFVKSKLEEGEGVSSESLARLLARAEGERIGGGHPAFFAPRAFLAAASLAVAACGWYFVNGAANARHERDVSNVIALLCAADGDNLDSGPSLSDALYAWQDAPTLAGAD